VRNFTIEAIANILEKNKLSQALACYYHVFQNILFIEDPMGIEYLQTPEVTITTRAGDCDCISCLLSSMLCSINIPNQFVKVGLTPVAYSHIFVRAFPDSKLQTPVILDRVAHEQTEEMVKIVEKGGKTMFYPILDENTINNFNGIGLGRLVEF